MILRDGIELYHASYTVIENIDLSLCARGKDFGRGFYVTTDYHQACRFIRTAIGKALKNGVPIEDENTGFVSAFEYKQSEEKDVRYLEFAAADEDWLHCVVAHRKSGLLKDFLKAWENYDIIAGKIANDSTNQVLTAYMNGFYGEVGSYEADEMAIKFLLPNKLSDQICFRTENAVSCLHFKDYKTVAMEEHS